MASAISPPSSQGMCFGAGAGLDAGTTSGGAASRLGLGDGAQDGGPRPRARRDDRVVRAALPPALHGPPRDAGVRAPRRADVDRGIAPTRRARSLGVARAAHVCLGERACVLLPAVAADRLPRGQRVAGRPAPDARCAAARTAGGHPAGQLRRVLLQSVQQKDPMPAGGPPGWVLREIQPFFENFHPSFVSVIFSLLKL